MDNRPIGVFDSGLGGLTVLKELLKKCPNESLVYFGDCGRIPYGTKSRETVQKFTMQDINFLLTKNVKAIVIACNTASAFGYEMAKEHFDLPIFEVVTPGARAAVRETRNEKIGVIGTPGTITSGVYESAIHKVSQNAGIKVVSKACPLFVPLVEEGWWDNEIAMKIVEEYLLPLKTEGIDTLVLGCTHYPILEKAISRVLGEGIRLVSSGVEIAAEVDEFICSQEIVTTNDIQKREFYTSDSIEKFAEMGKDFLGMEIPFIEHVEIDRF
ncbi:MAG: glutamate racemase [Bacillota bacterium]